MTQKIFVFIVFFLFTACSTTPFIKEKNPDILYAAACRHGKLVERVHGSVWMHVNSKEASGQFPATVEVQKKNQNLKMEVTNLLGGTEAFIEVKNGRIQVDLPNKGVRKGKGTWGGIPLRWTPSLFLGSVPCMKRSLARKSIKSVNSSHHLIVKSPANTQSFQYEFREVSGKPWPQAVNWKAKLKNGQSLEVRFEFEQPDLKMGLAKKWKIMSSFGEVSVRWKKRDLSSSKSN